MEASFRSYQTAVIKKNEHLEMLLVLKDLEKIKTQYKPSRADLDMLLRKIREIIKEGVYKRFKTQTDPEGKPWKSVQRGKVIFTKYGAKKAKTGRFIKSKQGILYDTGKLFRSLKFISNPRSSTIEFGSLDNNVPYAAVHQFGSKDRRNIAARPYLGFDKEMMEKIQNLMSKFEKKLALQGKAPNKRVKIKNKRTLPGMQ